MKIALSARQSINIMTWHGENNGENGSNKYQAGVKYWLSSSASGINITSMAGIGAWHQLSTAAWRRK